MQAVQDRPDALDPESKAILSEIEAKRRRHEEISNSPIRSLTIPYENFFARRKEIEEVSDPAIALANESEGTVAVKIDTEDNEMSTGTITIRWLRCESAEEAEEYIASQGGENSFEPTNGISSSAEGCNINTSRTIHIKRSSDVESLAA
jgi:hypothetical protein